MHQCRICDNSSQAKTYKPREMYFASRDEFEYFLCDHCGCLQISDIPENLDKYYPSHYSPITHFKSVKKTMLKSKLRSFLDQRRVKHELEKTNFLGWLGNKLAKPLDYAHWLKSGNCTTKSRILDVGCGGGKLLTRMQVGGIKNCQGVDQFIDESTIINSNLNITKANFESFVENEKSQYDFIMAHHSLEHMPDINAAMQGFYSLLKDNGVLLIRIPVLGKAWETYGINWFNLDAPRHLYLLSQKTMQYLAQKHDFLIFKTEYDSTKAQFTWSEMYKRDIPHSDGRQPKDVLTQAQINSFIKLTKQVNQTGESDCAVFYLKKQK